MGSKSAMRAQVRDVRSLLARPDRGRLTPYPGEQGRVEDKSDPAHDPRGVTADGRTAADRTGETPQVAEARTVKGYLVVIGEARPRSRTFTRE